MNSGFLESYRPLWLVSHLHRRAGAGESGNAGNKDVQERTGASTFSSPMLFLKIDGPRIDRVMLKWISPFGDAAFLL